MLGCFWKYLKMGVILPIALMVLSGFLITQYIYTIENGTYIKTDEKITMIDNYNQFYVQDGKTDYENKVDVIDPKTQSIRNGTVTLRKTRAKLIVSDKLSGTTQFFIRKDSPKYKELEAQQNSDKSREAQDNDTASPNDNNEENTNGENKSTSVESSE